MIGSQRFTESTSLADLNEDVLTGMLMQSVMATAYAKHDVAVPAVVEPITGQLSSPDEPLQDWPPSMAAPALFRRAGGRRAHPDHVGGLLDAHGHPVFSNAELLIHPRELSFWEDDVSLARSNDRARGNFLLARQVFAGYRRNLRWLAKGNVLPGIRMVPLPGHRPGHSGNRVSQRVGQGSCYPIWD